MSQRCKTIWGYLKETAETLLDSRTASSEYKVFFFWCNHKLSLSLQRVLYDLYFLLNFIILGFDLESWNFEEPYQFWLPWWFLTDRQVTKQSYKDYFISVEMRIYIQLDEIQKRERSATLPRITLVLLNIKKYSAFH